MEYSIWERILYNNEILIELMLMLDAEDQLSFTRLHENIEKVFWKYIWKRKFKLDSNIIEFDENFKELIEKNCKKLTTLSVNGGQVNFNCHCLKSLVNLTEISLYDITLSTDQLYNMAGIAKNMEILKLQNINYKWSESLVNSSRSNSLKMESLKKLQLQYHIQLELFIENCQKLEELIINNIHENSISNINHSLLSSGIIKSTLNVIKKDHAEFSEYFRTNNMNFEIIAKKDHATIIYIDSITLQLFMNSEKYIEYFNLMHLENVKMLFLNFYGEHCTHMEFMKLITENCKQLRTLRFAGTLSLIRGLKIKTLVSLKEVYNLFTVTDSADDLFHILKDLNLDSCELNWNIFCNSWALPENQTYGNSIKLLICNGQYSPEQNIEIFFQLYPNGFQSLKQLCLYDFVSIDKMLELALKHFRNIKCLEIKGGAMNEKTLTTLSKFPLLKYLKIHGSLRFNQAKLEYLRNDNNRIIVIDLDGRRV